MCALTSEECATSGGAVLCPDARKKRNRAMTAVLDLSGGPDVGLSGWLVPLHCGIRDPSAAVRLPDKPGDVLAIGRSAKLSSRRTPQRTVTVTALLLDDDRTPPQVSGDHAEIELSGGRSADPHHAAARLGNQEIPFSARGRQASAA